MVALIKPEPRDDENPPETIEFIFGLTKDLPERQAHDWEAMEAKAVQILTAASFIVGLSSIGSMAIQLQPVQAVVFGAGVVAYLGVLACTVMNVWTRDITLSRQAAWLWDHRHNTRAELMESLVQDIIRAYEGNEGVIRAKSRFIRSALCLLGLEAVSISSALIWTRLT